MNDTDNTEKADAVRLDHLWRAHFYNHDVIRFADTKAAFLATATSTLIVLLLTSSGLQNLFKWPWFRACCLSSLLVSLTGLLALLLLVGSFLCAVAAIQPRFLSHPDEPLIFSSGIARHSSARAYHAEIAKLNGPRLEEAVALNLFTLASISQRKYLWVNRAIKLGALGAVLAFVTAFATKLTAC
jgi:hypothetical protein